MDWTMPEPGGPAWVGSLFDSQGVYAYRPSLGEFLSRRSCSHPLPSLTSSCGGLSKV